MHFNYLHVISAVCVRPIQIHTGTHTYMHTLPTKERRGGPASSRRNFRRCAMAPPALYATQWLIYIYYLLAFFCSAPCVTNIHSDTCTQIHTNTYVHCCVRNQHIAVGRQRRRRRRRIGHQTELLTVFQPLHRWQRQPAGRAAADFGTTADLHANRLRLQRELFSDVCVAMRGDADAVGIKRDGDSAETKKMYGFSR